MRRTRFMNLATFMLTISTCLTGIARAAPADTTLAPAEVADACRACHQGPMALTGRASDALAAAMRAIRDGRRAHPPLPPLDAEDIEAVARLLSSQ